MKATVLNTFSAGKSRKKSSSLQYILAGLFLGIISVSGFLFSNYLSEVEQTTTLSKASEVIRCGFIGDDCLSLQPGQFGLTTDATQNECTLNTEKTLCVVSSRVAEELEEVAVNDISQDIEFKISPQNGAKFSKILELQFKVDLDNVEYVVYYKVNDGKYEEYLNPFEIYTNAKVKAKLVINGETVNSIDAEYFIDENIVEDDGENIDSFMQYDCNIDDRVVTLSWKFDKGYTYYRVFLDHADNGVTPMDLTSLDRDIFTSESQIVVPIELGVEYRAWGVLPLERISDGYGAFNDYIDSENLMDGTSFACGTEKLNYRVYSPLITNTSTIELTGIKGNEFSILIDGNEVSNLSEVSWEYKVALDSIGENLIPVEIKTESGVTDEFFIKIIRCTIGDLNCDGYVDIADTSWYVQAVNEFTQFGNFSNEYITLSDMAGTGEDPDGSIDIRDFIMFKSKYNN